MLVISGSDANMGCYLVPRDTKADAAAGTDVALR